jgi:hypothetical protein
VPARRPETFDHLFQVFRITRREQNLMAGLYPKFADGAADIPRADDTDFHSGSVGVRLPANILGLSHQGKQQCGNGNNAANHLTCFCEKIKRHNTLLGRRADWPKDI